MSGEMVTSNQKQIKGIERDLKAGEIKFRPCNNYYAISIVLGPLEMGQHTSGIRALADCAGKNIFCD